MKEFEPPIVPPLAVTHYFTHFRSLGGVESILHHHHDQDAGAGLDSRFVIYFEPVGSPVARVHFLAQDTRGTIGSIRHQLRATGPGGATTVAAYHSLWGMPWLAELDQSARRLAILHSETPGLSEELQFRRDWLDGVLCVSEPLRQRVRAWLPGWEESRLAVLPYPISPPEQIPGHPALAGRPMVIGFCSRLVREQKRVERLPALCRQLTAAGLDYRLEFLGDGPERAWLENQFPNRKQFVFHGRKSGGDYWQILAGWDVFLSVSDYEGTPIALLEALSQGVLPVYPRIGSGGDSYARAIQPGLLYPPQDWPGVASLLNKLCRQPEADVQPLRARCRETAAPHLGNAYLEKFSAFARSIAARPRISQNTFPRRPFPIDHLPFTWLKPLGAVRRFWRRWAA
ncbi:MAG: glycosyltransferase family 4 protein [Verrucomicrobia bacterium]|nr:glycosyltransferase family 4 protein [Verrucomicrobiota bacterium]